MNRPLRTKTLNSSPTYLTSDETYIRTTNNQIQILPNQSVAVTANITARDNNDNTAHWIILGVFKREEGIVSMPESPAIITMADDTDGLWNISMEADAPNIAGSIVFSGASNVNVVANIQTNEVSS
jgi:hypothetical protein